MFGWWRAFRGLKKLPLVPLSFETRRRLSMLFDGDDAREATELLIRDCGSNLRFLERLDATQLERFRFAALKLSEGRMDQLRKSVELAKRDWRDLLMAAGFGHDVHAHERWEPRAPDHPDAPCTRGG